jgi:LmbE family N-acetylglucosaminyl deacetylase
MTAHTAVSAPLSGRSFLFLHAHPDDEAIFTGITMRRLSALGARVVLVTATAGEEGGPAGVRVAELEAACTALGVARLELLGRRDSGMAGTPANHHPWALARADIASLVGQLAALCAAESVEALVHYDADGIYGHPDHVSVHHIGSAAASLAGITGYEATVDREYLHFTGRHLVEGPAPRRDGRHVAGQVSAEITTAIFGTAEELAAKRLAMAAHASQIDAAHLLDPAFDEVYRLEWYVRRGGSGVLEELGNAHLTSLLPS